jgi:outer membrane protein assembly factor BamB
LTAIALAMVMSLGGCDWAMFGSDAARSRSNPESVVAPADRASMSTLFSAPTGDDVVSSPAVAGGVVYVCSSDDKLYAFDAMGAANCSPGVVTCQPLWTATTGARIVSSPAVAGGVVYVGSDERSSPAVANGVVYVGSNDHRLYAFDAAGTVNCTGTPTTCTPLFSADVGDVAESSPAVANGMVYIGGAGTRAFRLP